MTSRTGRSVICDFFKEQTVLLTGATGFMGKALICKLLRTCPPKTIYLLVRPKKGKDPQQRIDELFNEPVFDKMKKEVPDFMKIVTGVRGDATAEGLGLSADTRRTLAETVTVVIHAAATVSFDEKLSEAVRINITGTREIIKLCKEMPNLRSVCHVSTAFSHCSRKEIDEIFYDAPISPDNLIALVNSLDDKQLIALTPSILRNWPNTYAFTKAVAEQVIRDETGDLPIAMFRPSIIMGAMEEPEPGWTDNLYGPTGVIVGTGAGVMRVVPHLTQLKADLIPIDVTVNALLTVVYETTLSQQPNKKIYNCVSSAQNPLTWGDFHASALRHGSEAPTIQTLWYYVNINPRNRISYFLSVLFLHILPGILVDLGLVLTKNKPRMMKIYSKIHKFVDVIVYFCSNEWRFHDGNIQMLWSNMPDADKRLFNFDVKSIDWDQYLRVVVHGVRRFIFKESLDNLPEAKKRFYRLDIA
ncbi:hypothetical protein AAG570_010321 [Ranatra chinensis]|uniref:Fatty acyl-CoA reductase n=1 Tax=Ranatra chinensis TaxID=642074 RepID=A0ABD0YML6_9HEMI